MNHYLVVTAVRCELERGSSEKWEELWAYFQERLEQDNLHRVLGLRRILSNFSFEYVNVCKEDMVLQIVHQQEGQNGDIIALFIF